MTPDSLAAVSAYFTPEVLANAREYLGRSHVLVLRQTGSALVAQVQGDRRRPYRVEVALTGTASDVSFTVTDLQGYCACAVGRECQHIAAAASLLWQRLSPRPSAAPEAPPALVVDDSREALLSWAQGVALRGGVANEEHTPPKTRRELRFVVEIDGEGLSPPVVHTVGVAGGREQAVDLDDTSKTARNRLGKWVGVDDRLLYHELRLRERHAYGYAHVMPRLPPDETGPKLLARLVATGRAHLGSADGPRLQWKRAKRAELGWRLDHRGTQTPALLGLPAGAQVVGLRPPHWVDTETGHCGAVHCDLPPTAAQTLAHAPALSAESTLEASAWPVASGIPAPRVLTLHTLPAVAPIAVLSLHGEARAGGWARLSFRYGEAVCDPGDPYPEASIVSEATQVLRAPRDRAAEAKLMERLAQTGLSTSEIVEPDAEQRWPSLWTFADAEFGAPGLVHEEAWLSFAAEAMPALTAEGWRVERCQGFVWTLSVVDAWYAEVEESDDGDWFTLSVGVEIDGVRVGVLPAVKRALKRGLLQPSIPAQGVVLELGEGRRVRMPADRLRVIVGVLLELSAHRPFDGQHRLRLPRAAAARLLEIDPERDLRWYGTARLRELGERLTAGVPPDRVAVPPTVTAELRDYQHQGLAWLQFLRHHAVGGLLADDMGLGKTLQTLAHIAVEKHAGRLDRPCLVVAPTSVLPVWCAEAARFTPHLSVSLHHGSGRTRELAMLAGHDIIVTSYALLLRDVELLSALGLHLAVLDEAGAIKNPSAKISAAARRLNARTRLCLTGTPVENDLSELWAQLDFVMPGLLGTPRRFATVFRTPIEVEGDEDRRQALIRRIAPFLLRRTKADVLPELPPKTEQIRYAELGREQRDLYEAVRLAADAQVREVIDDKGLARSQIGVLAALLKLREVCCDPRLVAFPAASGVTQSAKLTLLMETVVDLVAAGRRILVFSQFTRMLRLIETALGEHGIASCKLTGRTRNRDEVVARFEAGDVPVFLVSLKAGGTGLNLTTADTVIHFDPWWNPAAQDQATDRAHRIGQDKPVLVLSLVARGTVEERMLRLQAGKRTLADGVLEAAAARGRSGRLRLGEDEVAALLAPLATQ